MITSEKRLSGGEELNIEIHLTNEFIRIEKRLESTKIEET